MFIPIIILRRLSTLLLLWMLLSASLPPCTAHEEEDKGISAAAGVQEDGLSEENDWDVDGGEDLDKMNLGIGQDNATFLQTPPPETTSTTTRRPTSLFDDVPVSSWRLNSTTSPDPPRPSIFPTRSPSPPFPVYTPPPTSNSGGLLRAPGSGLGVSGLGSGLGSSYFREGTGGTTNIIDPYGYALLQTQIYDSILQQKQIRVDMDKEDKYLLSYLKSLDARVTKVVKERLAALETSDVTTNQRIDGERAETDAKLDELRSGVGKELGGAREERERIQKGQEDLRKTVGGHKAFADANALWLRDRFDDLHKQSANLIQRNFGLISKFSVQPN